MEQEIIYPGVGLNEKLKNGKTAGRIILTGHSLRFKYDEGHIELALQDLKIKRGGSSGQLVFLEHPSHPGWILYTEKKAILKHLQRLSRPDISGQITDIKKKRMRVHGIILAAILAVAALIFGLLQLRNPIAGAIARSIPVEWEQKLGKSVFEQYKEGRQLIVDPFLLASLDKITAPLLNRIPDKRYDFHVSIVDEPSINAFALPGGYVVLHSGLLLSVDSAEELLGVLAHEIAHVTRQHGLRKIIDSLGFFLILKIFFGERGGLWTEMVKSGAFLLNREFSRSFEREADKTGFSYLVNARINPSGMITFFERLFEESKKGGAMSLNNALNFLSTHPAPETRMKYLQKKWNRLPARTGFLNFEPCFETFRESLKKKIQQR